MNILHLSDTHGAHRSLGRLPEADVIVHSGDIAMNGSSSEALDFMRWFSALPYAHKIFVAGNHDACLYGAFIDGLDSNCHYLCNSSVEIEGVTFYGVPMFMEDCSSGRQKEFYEMIPDGVDVLITHAPPYGILDQDGSIHYGSYELLSRVTAVRSRIHLFGHIHKANGLKERGETVFSNAAGISAIISVQVKSAWMKDFCQYILLLGKKSCKPREKACEQKEYEPNHDTKNSNQDTSFKSIPIYLRQCFRIVLYVAYNLKITSFVGTME